MTAFLFLAAVSLWHGVSAQTQTIPNAIWGKWVVSPVLPTTAISCWGTEEARPLIDTEIEYSAALFRWKNVVVNNPVAKTETVSAKEFHDYNSGRGANASEVTFAQLGIKAKQAVQISIQHAPADVTGATVEIPGDHVLIRDGDTLVFSVCGLYFEARRAAGQSPR